MIRDKLQGALEAVLFAAGEPMTVGELANVMQLEKPQIWDLISSLEEAYKAETSGLYLREVAEGFQLVTKPEYYDLLTNLTKKKTIKLSNAAMETLSIVAFRQPVTRAEMEAVRGVKVDGVLGTLLDLGLVAEAGRKKALGNPILYATTDKFLTTFGLKSLDDLPMLEDEEPDGEEQQQLLKYEE